MKVKVKSINSIKPFKTVKVGEVFTHSDDTSYYIKIKNLYQHFGNAEEVKQNAVNLVTGVTSCFLDEEKVTVITEVTLVVGGS